MQYEDFVAAKTHTGADGGLDPVALPDALFDFQRALVTWALRKGRAAIFADCGLGKTLMQLAWADNVIRHTNRPVLILTPLAVSHQTVAEASRFGIDAARSVDGQCDAPRAWVTNYERLHHFDASAFAGVVCDESSILKSFDGVTRQAVTDFMRKTPYRLLCTATAAPNDYIELGTASEALGYLGYTDMLTRFFKNENNSVRPFTFGVDHRYEGGMWRFKGHAELPFWRWVCSWARAMRKPSDLGFDDDRFELPALEQREHLVTASRPAEGMLFELPAVGLREQREERRRTIAERCDRVAELVADTGAPALVWCHLNEEGDRLERLTGGLQVSGADSDDEKEEAFLAFIRGEARVLVTKPSIGAWGLNFQHCAHVVTFPSHSFEQFYQSIRRCWRFGQTRPVVVDVVRTEGDKGVLQNLQRKAARADTMFANLVAEMTRAQGVAIDRAFNQKERVPAWL